VLFAAESFDAAISACAFEDCVEPVSVLPGMQIVTKGGGRIILLGPTCDFPFWYPSAVLSRQRVCGCGRFMPRGGPGGQVRAMLGGRSPFVIIEVPDVLTQPFVYDSNAVYVAWTYEVIRQMKEWGCRLIHCEAYTPLLGEDAQVRFGNGTMTNLPAHRYAGSAVPLVFEN